MKQVTRSLAFRLTVWFLLLSFFPLGVIAVFVRQNVAQSMLQLTIEEHTEHAHQLAVQLALPGDPRLAPALLDALGAPGSPLFIVDPAGKYLAHSDPARTGDLISTDFSTEVTRQILSGSDGGMIDPQTGSMISYATIPGSDRTAVMISITPHSAGLTADMEKIIFLLLAGTALISSLAAGFIIWLFVGLPMHKLTYASQQISQGWLDFKVNPDEMTDELAVLARTFNQMTLRLRELFDGLEQRLGELHTAQAALKESELLYRSLVNALPDGIALIDLSGRAVFASPAFVKIYGADSEKDVLGTDTMQWFAPETHEKATRHIQALLLNQRSPDNEYMMLRKDGTRFMCEITGALLTSETGSPKLLVTIHRDISERKHIEEARLSAEERYRVLVEHSLQGLVIAQGNPPRFAFSNSAMTEISGFTPDEIQALSGRQIGRMIYSGDRVGFFDLYTQFLSGASGSPHYLMRILRKDGELRWWQIFASSIQYQGQPAVQAAIIDITDRHRIETDLRKSEANLSALIENTDDFIWSIDRQYHVIVANSQFRDTMSRLLGRTFNSGESVLYDGLDSNSRLVWQGFYDRALAGEKFSIEREASNFGTPVWLSYHFNPIHDADGQISGVTIIQRDITEIRQAADTLEKAYDTTLEGWSRAMDLRDRETEGHTQRVTDLTVYLAREYGISDEDIVHIRRGALLHDIGKMGVPDQILTKPGGLSNDEWEVMHRHPGYAYELIKPIDFLRPALGIPYCHHEKWDGSGYPQGLVGDQIPLAARIFAVLDVWDALLSERPYSTPWTFEKAKEYIVSQAAVQFDPQIVALFERCLNQSDILYRYYRRSSHAISSLPIHAP